MCAVISVCVCVPVPGETCANVCAREPHRAVHTHTTSFNEFSQKALLCFGEKSRRDLVASAQKPRRAPPSGHTMGTMCHVPPGHIVGPCRDPRAMFHLRDAARGEGGGPSLRAGPAWVSCRIGVVSRRGRLRSTAAADREIRVCALGSIGSLPPRSLSHPREERNPAVN